MKPVAWRIASTVCSSSDLCAAGESATMSGWVQVWSPIMSPLASIARSTEPVGSYSLIWSPISKNEAGTW